MTWGREPHECPEENPTWKVQVQQLLHWGEDPAMLVFRRDGERKRTKGDDQTVCGNQTPTQTSADTSPEPRLRTWSVTARFPAFLSPHTTQEHSEKGSHIHQADDRAALFSFSILGPRPMDLQA